MPPLIASAETVTDSNVTLTATAVTIVPVLYCSPTVSIAEAGTPTGLFIYPNPSPGILHVRLNHLQTAQIKIINVLGEVVLSKPVRNGENSLDVSDLQNGIYFVIGLSGRQHLANLKLVVVK